MKLFRIAALAVCAVIAMSFASCSDDDDDTKTSKIKFNPAVATVQVGSTQKVLIAGGEGLYTAKSSDEKTASVTVEKDTVFVKGIKAGNAMVVVTDSKKMTGNLSVNVFNALAISKSTTTLAVGKEDAVTISGGVIPYTVASTDSKIATATVKGTKLTVHGVAAGTTTITVTDKNKATATLTVTVTK